MLAGWFEVASMAPEDPWRRAVFLRAEVAGGQERCTPGDGFPWAAERLGGVRVGYVVLWRRGTEGTHVAAAIILDGRTDF